MEIINRLFRGLIVGCMVLAQSQAYALPSGEAVVPGSGSATFNTSVPGQLTVNQNTGKVIINYDSFSIGQAETVQFNQPNASSIALNRVTGTSPSSIMGTLRANGQIFLINPNGVLFGRTAQVDVRGLVASNMNISNADFSSGNYFFQGKNGSVINQGVISAPGGYVALIGSHVINSGYITADLGSVALAAGNKVTLSLDPRGIVNVAVKDPAIFNASVDAAVRNDGVIQANGGKVILTAKALNSVFDHAVNNDGVIEARSIKFHDGKVFISGDKDVAIGGTIDGGDVTVASSAGDVVHELAGVVTTHGGDFKGTAARDYILTDGSSVDSGNGTIDILAGRDIRIGAPSRRDVYRYAWRNGGDSRMYGGEGDFDNVVFQAHVMKAEIPAGAAIRSDKDVFLTALNGGISQTGGDLAANNLMLSTKTGMQGVGFNGGLLVKVNNLSAVNRGSGDIRVKDLKDLAVADLTSRHGLNSGVQGTNGVDNKASGGAIDLAAKGDMNVKAPVIGRGNIILRAAVTITQFKGGDITIDRVDDALMGVPANVHSTSHPAGVWESGVSNDPTVDVSWELPAVNPDAPSYTAQAWGGYTMEKGSHVKTNGGAATITTDGSIVLTQVDAGNGNVAITSNHGSILDGDSGTVPYDYDVIGHSILLSAPEGTVGQSGPGREIDLGAPDFRFSYVWDEAGATIPDKSADAYTTSLDPVTGAWTFTTTSKPLADAVDWNFHIVGLYGSQRSAAVHLGPFFIDATAPVITAGTPSGTQNKDGTYAGDVTVPFGATDNLSGFAPDGAVSIDLASQTAKGPGTGLRVTSEGVYDRAGNFTPGIQAGPFDSVTPDKPLPVPVGGENLLNVPGPLVRLYYEVLSPQQLRLFEPVKPIGMYFYHPLTEVDQTAMSDVELSTDAYNYIDDLLKKRKSEVK